MSAAPTSLPVQTALLHQRILDWYDVARRDLPWRDGRTSAWGVFVSEVMSHQTPVARVAPVWQAWMQRWPTPAALAAAAPGEAVRHWDRLGYPRRALRLHEAAAQMVRIHHGQVPNTYPELLALPGVGPYTAAAVLAFAFGGRATVVDINVRRAQARLVRAEPLPAPSMSRAEQALATALLPSDDEQAARWNAAIMELGALICTARNPRCGACPVIQTCAWQAAGAPPYTGPARRGQAWAGTDRQVRGRILALLRESPDPLDAHALATAWPEDELKLQRCLASLIEDGLVEPLPRERYCLPR
ncbi:A/G-specific adenine glycosylase [Gephyromycinifex aptenodytis]|uniref:A/G-specific adenine glycosylase n=1 Tax=Gephyromycinifex aptenodytis TaxID=2716227 RepID=UPI0014456DE0|nr:A/G-specific adenine glycosylase [Gephyromycinifex aptenodytis]